MKLKTIILTSATLLNGCAFNQTIDYSTGYFKFNKFELDSKNGCSINVIENRSYVKSGSKDPSFVGLYFTRSRLRILKTSEILDSKELLFVL